MEVFTRQEKDGRLRVLYYFEAPAWTFPITIGPSLLAAEPDTIDRLGAAVEQFYRDVVSKSEGRHDSP